MCPYTQDAEYAAHMRLRLVLYRMSLLWRAVHVHGHYSYGLMLCSRGYGYACHGHYSYGLML